jgi:hypothetical protein
MGPDVGIAAYRVHDLHAVWVLEGNQTFLLAVGFCTLGRHC